MRKVEGWGWVGVGTTEKGVARIVLPKSSKKAVEKALQDFSQRGQPKPRRKLSASDFSLLER